MTFSFTAIGTREEVQAQLSHVGDGDGQIAPELASLITAHLSAAGDPWADPHHHTAYVVHASGHSASGHQLTLKVEVTPHYVRKTAPVIQAGHAPRPVMTGGIESPPLTPVRDHEDKEPAPHQI